MEQALQPGEGVTVAEDALRDPAAVDRAVVAEDPLAKPPDQRGLNL
jgi:hypothetical protein